MKTFATKRLVRHSDAVVGAADVATRRREEILRAAGAILAAPKVLRSGARTVGIASERVSDPDIQRELKAAFGASVAAVRRARKVGVRNVADDKNLTRELDHALEHTSKAVRGLRRTKKPHRLRWLVIGSVLVAGGYREWSRRSRDAVPSRPA